MKKILLALSLLVLTATPAGALAGPEPASSPRDFEIIFEEAHRPDGNLTYERLAFSMDDGWDFEDRDGYECANIARYDAQGNLLLLLEFEQSKDYLEGVVGGIFRINDRNGVEPGDAEYPDAPERPCGNESKDDPATPKINETVDASRWAPSGEDHFPHILEGNDPATHGVHIYRDGVIDQVATDSLNAQLFNAECDRDYWSPGDEERELVNWWDEDGPEDAHHDGSAPLDCGSGGAEPVAVARAYFSYLAPNMGVCILDHDHPNGAWCSGQVEPPQPPCEINPKTGECKTTKG